MIIGNKIKDIIENENASNFNNKSKERKTRENNRRNKEVRNKKISMIANIQAHTTKFYRHRCYQIERDIV